MLVLLAFAVGCGGGCGSTTEAVAPTDRPASWAAPLERPGLPNLHVVADGLYRGAQPEDAGFAELKRMGVKTVVNLRGFHSDRSECAAAGLDYVPIPVHAWHPEDEDVVEFLKVATDPERRPLFFHCQHGADRTGVMCAAYRIAVQGWSKDDAVEEMTGGDYGFHEVWKNLVAYVRGLDVEKLRAAVH